MQVPKTYIIIIVVTVLIILTIIRVLQKSKTKTKKQLKQVQETYTPVGDITLTFTQRALDPVYNQITKTVKKFAPGNISKEYDNIILQAGLSNRQTPIRILTNQILGALVVAGIGFFILPLLNQNISPLMIILQTLLAFYLPLYRMRKKAKKRKLQIEKALPYLLDLVYISVEAGLGFDTALKKTAQNMQGPLADEILRGMNDISKGRNRVDALKSIGERTQVDDVKTFITTIIQSERLGSNITNVLRVQSEVMRDKRRQRAEKEIQKMPVKMLIPIVFFIFPALFVIILGPAAVNLIAILPDLNL